MLRAYSLHWSHQLLAACWSGDFRSEPRCWQRPLDVESQMPVILILGPYWSLYQSCLLRLMRLLDPLGERG